MTRVRSAAITSVFQRLYRLVLIAYLFAVACGSRDFSRLQVNVAGIPLFPGEAVIALLLALAVLQVLKERRSPFGLDIPTGGMFAYLGIGMIFVVVGFLRGFGLAVLRDAALVYYGLIFFFSVVYVGNGGKPGDLLRTIGLGAVLGSTVRTVWFFLFPALSWGHAVPGYVGLVAWIGALYLALEHPRAKDRLLRALEILGILVCSFVVYLSGYKTLLAVVILGLGVLWVRGLSSQLADQRRGEIRAALLITLAVVVVPIAGIALAVELPNPAGPLVVNGPVNLPQAFQVLATRWAGVAELPGGLVGSSQEGTATQPADSMAQGGVATQPSDGTAQGGVATQPASSTAQAGTATQPSDGTAQDGSATQADDDTAAAWAEGSISFRREAWLNAIERIVSSPLVGIGFGPAPILYPDEFCELRTSPTSNCGNAHNSYLTLAMRMGIPAFLGLASLNLLIFARMCAAMWTSRRSSERDDLPYLILAVSAGFGAYALTSLFLESPYLSTLYWVALALAYLSGCSVHRMGNASARESTSLA